MGKHILVGGVQGMYVGGVNYAKVGQSHTAILSKYMDVKTQNLLGFRSVHTVSYGKWEGLRLPFFPLLSSVNIYRLLLCLKSLFACYFIVD